MKNFSKHRVSYDKGTLDENQIPNNPYILFETWINLASITKEVREAYAMNIATIGLDGFPKNRIVLLREFSDSGFIFYTNYESEKGLAIAQNSKVCLSFYWEHLEKQVIIKGIASKISNEKSELYFQSRPFESQISAYISPQSKPVADREFLNSMHKKMQLSPELVKKPKHWGGYEVNPQSFEFWQGRENRLHDRILYNKTYDNEFIINRLAP